MVSLFQFNDFSEAWEVSNES